MATDLLTYTNEVVEPEMFESPDIVIQEFKPYRIIEDKEVPEIDRSTLEVKEMANFFKVKVGDTNLAKLTGATTHRKNLTKSYFKQMYLSNLPIKAEDDVIPDKKDIKGEVARIMFEINQLESQVNEVGNTNSELPTGIEILNSLDQVKNQLSKLNNPIQNNSESTNTLQGELLLNGINNIYNNNNNKISNQSINYEQQVSHALELESRITSLEALLGPETLIKSNLPHTKSLTLLISTMLEMFKKIQKPNHLFKINKRLKLCILEMDKLVSLKQTLKQLGSDQVILSMDSELDTELKIKVDRMFNVYTQFDHYLNLGDKFSNRLKHLGQVHHQSSLIEPTLNQIEQNGNKAIELSNENQLNYQQLSSKLASTQLEINSKLQDIDSKLANLVERLKAI